MRVRRSSTTAWLADEACVVVFKQDKLRHAAVATCLSVAQQLATAAALLDRQLTRYDDVAPAG
jgi:hypothetical protein